ncbi:tetratricopeptide repeat protein [Trinickia terrae]|uniref:Tetratricopeptide repeat protein n=1 Tax=Trinickia terrae TaxID=2571161 RepID=A0A4U1I7U9_9BURK|nr:tetratricopeptide repeat protein [Trinickia terrae]TKC89506.1 tetratricopeptide repeat protein [Trinickia terrae]
MSLSIAAKLEAAQQHFHAGRLDEAAQLLREAADADPANGDALEGLAYIAASQRDAALAADYFDRALAHLPASAERLRDAGTANQAAGRHARAVELLESCLQFTPRDLPTLNAAAMSLSELGAHERALQMLVRAREVNPGLWQVHYNMGRALGLLGRYDDEMAAYRRAIELKPDCVAAYVNLGVALRDLHRFDEALRVFRKAVQLDPNDAGARTNRAQTNLLLGQFEHGWREYEWRWRDGSQRHDFGERVWLGDAPLAGKTLLLHSEQGFGDTLQFVRYIDRFAGQGARIVLRVQDALLPLLSDFPGVDRVIGERDGVPPFDYHCPLLGLPHALKAHTAPIPAAIPYLHADPARRAQWRERLAGERGPRIGVAWSGSTTHVNDRNRSMRLLQWTPLFDAAASFVSLVKDVREADRETLRQSSAVRDVSASLETFADTAALIAELDLVICVDTAVAHLAGALGKPVWILLPYTPDWRWQLGRADSPWYPGARLFRQSVRGDWAPVIAQVRAALDAPR